MNSDFQYAKFYFYYFIITGSIAEREHLKWQNAAPIDNNPYAPEKLQRRLSEKHTSGTFDIPHSLQSNSNEVETKIETRPNERVTTSPEKLVDVFKADKQDYMR